MNTAVGFEALYRNSTGSENTATGANALQNNINGTQNSAFGVEALYSNTTGGFNTANGESALGNNTTGSHNTAMGGAAFFSNTTSSRNVALGETASVNVTTAHDVIAIGAAGANMSNSCFIGQIFGATSSGGIAVFINSDGRLGTATFSRRFKEEIRPMDSASEVLFALKPVTFHYKEEIDPKKIPQFGLLAEEVERLNPHLIVRDKEGKPHSVRYDQVNAMFLNELSKEHRKVQEQEATIAQLKSTLAKKEMIGGAPASTN